MNTKLFVSVRDRYQCTVACIQSLISTSNKNADVIIFDNSSTTDLHQLMKMYEKWIADDLIAQVILNRNRIMPDVYWSKNYAWQQALLILDLLPPSEREFLVMIDNDIIAKPGWLEACFDIWNSSDFIDSGARVISPYDGPPRYNSEGRLTNTKSGTIKNFGGHPCYIRSDLVSRFWFTSYEYWITIAPPQFTKVIRDGQEDRMPTDFWYFSQMKKRGEKFAVLQKPLVHDPNFKWSSARMSNKIGADAQSNIRKPKHLIRRRSFRLH